MSLAHKSEQRGQCRAGSQSRMPTPTAGILGRSARRPRSADQCMRWGMVTARTESCESAQPKYAPKHVKVCSTTAYEGAGNRHGTSDTRGQPTWSWQAVTLTEQAVRTVPFALPYGCILVCPSTNRFTWLVLVAACACRSEQGPRKAGARNSPAARSAEHISLALTSYLLDRTCLIQVRA